MRLLLDECSGAHTLVERLIAAGHDAERSVEALGIAAADEAVLTHATDAGRVIITMNCDDFLELVSDGRPHPGLLLHYRGANGGLSYDEIVTAVYNIGTAFERIDGMSISLNQWAWKPR